MLLLKEHWASRPALDEGFSLIEALIALIIFSVALLAALPTVLNALVTEQNLQLRQNVVSLASGELERLQALPANAPTGECVPLLTGRRESDVRFQENNPPAGAPMDNMQLVFNPSDCLQPASVTPEGIASLANAVDQTEEVDGVDVRIRTYVGECVLSTTVEGRCVHPSSQSTDNANRIMYRLMVHAQWSDPGCPEETCTHWTSTLRRQGREPLFRDFSEDSRVDVTEPITVRDRSFTVFHNVRNPLGILGNDTNGYLAREVIIVNPPSKGWLEGNPLEDTFSYSYVDGSYEGGNDSFTYRLVDFDGDRVGNRDVTVRLWLRK